MIWSITSVLINILVFFGTTRCSPVPIDFEESLDYGYCSVPLGIARDSINIQVGFTVGASEGDHSNINLDPFPAWMPHRLHDRTHIQVEFQEPMMISGIITQGSSTTRSRVTHFKVMYSLNCINFTAIISENGLPTIFAANLEANTTTTTMFDEVLIARCVKIIPTERVGEETAIRFELLGCNQSTCQSEILPYAIENEWNKKVMFDTEKIVTGMKINIFPDDLVGVPAFIVAFSRTCNFYSAKFLSGNDLIKVFTPEDNLNEILVTDTMFPVRAQCFAVFSPDPSRLNLPDVYVEHRHDKDFQKIDLDQFEVTFEGCDALEPHGNLDSCGKTHKTENRRQKRVVGGVPSVPGEWPWLVSLHFKKPHGYTDQSGLKHLCGASLIDPLWILTAGHCFDALVGEGLPNKTNWLVVLGEHYQADIDGTEQVKDIEKIIPHPDFVLSEHSDILHDIALVKLSSPAAISDYVNTICLEPDFTFPDGTTCVTAGWGNTRVNGSGVELPNHAEVKIIPQSVCENQYNLLDDDHPVKEAVSIVDSVICAMAEENGEDACKGDSGGPLICYHDGHWTQIGIVSIGYECADIRYPGIYTKVNYFYDWINEVITNN